MWLAVLLAASPVVGTEYSSRELDALPTPATDALEAEINSISTIGWGEKARLRAEKISHTRMEWWIDCLVKREYELRDAAEDVATIAIAVVYGCPRLEAAFQKAYALSFRGLMPPAERVAEAQRFARDAKEKTRLQVISRLVEYRARQQANHQP